MKAVVEENRVLKEQVTGRRLRRTDDQGRRLTAKGLRLGRRILRQVATIVTPDTISGADGFTWRARPRTRMWCMAQAARRPTDAVVGLL